MSVPPLPEDPALACEAAWRLGAWRLQALEAAERHGQARRALLFGGHRIDAPGRTPPRFPPALAGAARERIEAALTRWGAGPSDLALAQAAAGADLMFLEACVARGLRCQVLLPQAEDLFVQHSVLSSVEGERWLARWQALKPRLGLPLAVLPAAAEGGNVYERCNRWLVQSALALSTQPPRLLCLWNGLSGDGPGGTAHLIDEVRRWGGEIDWIDTHTLAPATTEAS